MKVACSAPKTQGAGAAQLACTRRGTRGPGARRGILLLVILALLAMFGLAAMAFVLVTSQHMQSSRAGERIGQSDVQPEEELDEAWLEAAVGSTNPLSVLRSHSLLEDLYGQVPIANFDDDGDGNVDEADERFWYLNTIAAGDLDVTICGGQLIEFTVPGGIRRVGSVLTMLSGLAAGQSTRIVAFNPANSKCQMLAFESATPREGDQYLINGTPFSGTGFGFNPTTGRLDAKLKMGGGWKRALLPNPVAFPTTPGVKGYDPYYADPAGPGGANEDYDAVDFQNMLLAAQIVDTSTGEVVTIPSLHRPALVNYWMNQTAENWSTNLPLQRRVMLRPLGQDHYMDLNGNRKWDAGEPDFTGKVFDPVNGPWDVDNDGDGYLDGIWVDLGMPVRSTPDGRLFKPLFSFLCVDLDGRLNVNAHGNWDQTRPGYYFDVTSGTGVTTGELPQAVLDRMGTPRFAGGSTGPLPLPRGQGYGPAEINLRPVLQDPASLMPQWQILYMQLLGGSSALGLDGRYGEVLGDAAQAGVSGMDDWLSQNCNTAYAGNYWGYVSGGQQVRDAYGSAPNVYGSGSIGLDVAGRPLYLSMGQPNSQTTDDPYEIELSPKCSRGLKYNPEALNRPPDNPFSISEWERLERPFDRDASQLPGRLADLTNVDPTNPMSSSVLHRFRHAVTPESWDLGCPSIALPRRLRERLPQKRPEHITDLLRARNIPEATWKDLLPLEMLAGLKMDLNRPLGNGRDDNNNGVVDEPFTRPPWGEANEQLTVFQRPGTTATVPVSYGPDGTVPNALEARQRYARHLYVLLMLLADTDYLQAQLGGAEEAARFLAQWAINVVDFYDCDSIMTPFPFDPTVLQSGRWKPPSSSRYVVWGCERPELLISETLAFHDRRTEDLEEPDKKTDDKKEPDEDFDQKKRPQGSLFVELFNPWTWLEPPPGEFCCQNGNWASGIRLNQVTPGGHPVWRLVVTAAEKERSKGKRKDPDDPVATERPNIERSVYFVNLSASGFSDPKDGQPYYPDAPATIAPIKPGRYAVIGPGGGKTRGAYTTYIGERSDGGLPNETRRITLEPNPNPDTMQVEVFQKKGASELPISRIRPATAVVINQPRRLSISEPVGGYKATDPDGQPYDEAAGGYPKAYDQPLDADGPMASELARTATRTGVAIVHLQRLANPLMDWNATYNPYLTIDSMPVDLTAFNGVTSDQDPQDQGGDVMFHTRQRGEKEEETTPGIRNIWPQEPSSKPVVADAQPGVTNHYFNKRFVHTLGYLNKPFGPPTADPSGAYLGDPQSPFPWLTWNNRPFVSQLELLLVPAVRSSKLLVREEKVAGKYSGGFGIVRPGETPQPYGPALQNIPYPHLLSFFQSGKSTADPADSPQLHRLLEYVHVPSRYVGTRLQGNPSYFAAAGRHWYHPPFHLISRYREPGRINLNTIFEQRVFQGLMNFFPGLNTDEAWQEFVRSRRGYDGGASLLEKSASYPTYFAAPFRSFAGGEMVPLADMEPQREIEATLLRSDPTDGNRQRPLFHYDHGASPPAAYPDDTNRNPYFRYLGLERLGNLVTTRSNVYAIWITVGYFEVEPNPGGIDDGHPDGYKLVQELGVETGEIERHRAFYVFDRSIPVGFRRGEDLNVEKAVLLKRFIE